MASLHRSVSASGMKFAPPQFFKPPQDFQSEGYLISSALWQEVTGEKVNPYDMMSVLFSKPGFVASAKSLEIIKMTQDRAGSLEVQKKLDEAPIQERMMIIESLIPKAAELAIHPCANFVIQKICEIADENQMAELWKVLYAHIKTIIPVQPGCRVIQKFLENSTDQDFIGPIYEVIKSSFVELSISPFATHIIHKIIESLPSKSPEIVSIVTTNLNQLISNNSGCRVVQSIFTTYDKNVLRPLIDEVIRQANQLSTSSYGNYIVQTVLDIVDDDDRTKIVEVILDRFYEFSMHKLASNVTEKCIKTACQEERMKIFDVVIGKEGNFDYNRISHLSTDQYGNYVIQRVIDFGTKTQHDAIYTTASKEFETFNSTVYSRHVLAKLEEIGYSFQSHNIF